MSFRSWGHLACSLVLLIGAGCTFPVRERADRAVAEAVAVPTDIMPPSSPAPSSPAAAEAPSSASGPAATQKPAVEQPAPQPSAIERRLQIPPELPGAEAPPIVMPPDKAPRAERAAAVERLNPALPPTPPDLHPVPGPEGRPLTLADLQTLAKTNSPLLRQAAADVEAARGAAIQAGAYPNPTAGYEADQVGSSDTAGQQGGFVEQLIKTAHKLKLAQAAAVMDLENARVALRRAETDLTTQVRTNYFAVLVARENVRVTRALVRFMDNVYRIQVDQAKVGEAAPYEPMQLSVLALQAQTTLTQAQNRYTAAWKQLAATLGLPAMPLTELDGRADMSLPLYRHDETLSHVLAAHTDIATAQNTLQRARYNLRLAQVTPIPDVDVRVSVQKDYTGNPIRTQVGVQVGVPVPIWDRNKGGIIQAEGQLLRAEEETHRVQDDLTGRLAEAFARYESSRLALEYYRTRILPTQVRAYRAIYQRHLGEPDKVSFGDVITAQQTLATVLTTYVGTLGDAWTAVVDVANLAQTDNLFQGGEQLSVAPIPCLEELPCAH